MSDTLSYAVRYYVTKLTTASNLKIMTKHLNKLNKLREQDTDLQYKKNRTFIKHTITHCTNCQKKKNLHFHLDLDRHIPSRLNGNDIKTEFECLYQDIVKNVSALSEDERFS